MRLHHLSITAFGPFADTVEVDFDSLSSAGLFLLTGATGAGKTSVLDAVCFALYGVVPGDRSGAKHLRSDHAPAGRAPSVVLELSIGERRFRFTRSPAWTRPKLRGTGETTVQAHAVVEELRSGEWTALSNRLDEVGHLVGELLGMNCGQFTQVAMLPQGRFQAFLRASSSERHEVLQKLFRTDRFERVEKWLVERRTEARRASEAAASTVRAVLHRVEEAGGVPLPEELDADLARQAEDGAVAAWAVRLLEDATDRWTAADAALVTATAEDARASAALTEGRARLALVERARHAAADLELLDQQRAEHDRARRRLAGHHKAAPVAALAERSAASAAAAATAATGWEAELMRLRALDPAAFGNTAERALLVTALDEAREAQAAARAFLPREREIVDGIARAARTAAEHQAATDELTGLSSLLESLPARVAAADSQRDAATAAASGVDAALADVRRLETLATAAHRLTAVEAELVDARADLLAATSAAQAAREVYLDVREARINGMAAELAGALASGCSCPVCGSSQHPAPARAALGSVGRAEEESARRAHEDAAFVEQAQQTRVAALDAEALALGAQLDAADRASIPSMLTEARSTHAALAAAADRLTVATQDAVRARADLASATDRAQELQVRCAALAAEQAEQAATLGMLQAERSALLGDHAASIDDLVARRSAAVTTLDAGLAAWDSLRAATTAAEDDRDALLTSATGAGFATVDEALDALLTEAEAEVLATDLANADARQLAAEQTLADPAVRAAAQAEAPDVDALVAAQEVTARTLREQGVLADAARVRAERLTELARQLDQALAAWAPLRERQRLTADLASLVEGRSADNPLRMRLAAYVLAERLHQVVAAANERLARMTGQRYVLEHSEDRGVGELRGGLSLRVRDDWNGVHRDPATLSGGETFVVSLALALGLADTVAHESGGTDIDTLFIDEGFGSLDPDTLEDVMDTLDTLRDGGRVVGLVSHVPELRSRITTQLEVSKGRTGSTLRPVVVGG